MYNQSLKLEKNLNLGETKKEAHKILGEYIYDEEEKGYIYIQCPDVSDLFIITKSGLRKCDDQEWNWYFHNILYPSN